jgi:hypothetical protein
MGLPELLQRRRGELRERPFREGRVNGGELLMETFGAVEHSIPTTAPVAGATRTSIRPFVAQLLCEQVVGRGVVAPVFDFRVVFGNNSISVSRCLCGP